ncbi:MAG: LysR family transcriptional regulator [Acidihalobacter sp.]|uniref:LysR family transcriptional regulator n=1 Tax=Acidihalobacter sp. TaxID=1872108 RepID=UPI00307DDBFA
MARSDNDPLTGLNAFVCCAEAGSFTAAGRVLGLTPSAVSKAMTRLERDLGVRLFQRSPRAVTLSPEGAEFYAQSKDLVDRAAAARTLVSSLRGEPRGTLRVSAPVAFGEFILSKSLGEWLRQFPEVKVDLMLTDRIPDLVEERFDIAIRLGEPPDSRLVAHLIGQMPFLAVAAPGYLHARGTPTHPQQLADHACLGYLRARDGTLRRWTFEREGQRYEIEPQGPLCSGHGPVLLDAAVSGSGIAQLPRFMVKAAIENGTLVTVLEEYVSYGPPLYAVYSHNRHRSSTIQEFLAFVRGLSNQL